MPQGAFAIGGIASGLDTQGIIQQLLQVEAAPVQRLEARQDGFRESDEAWGEVTTKLSGLRDALGKIDTPAAFDEMMTVDSSDPEAVAVEVSGTPAEGSLSFTVDQLAQAHQAASGAFAGPEQQVGAGSVTLETADATYTIDTGEATTLADVATELNELDADVSAQVIDVGGDEHRLVLTGQKTGEANAFTLDSDLEGLDAVETIQQAQDAVLHVGAMEVRRADNTIDDLVEGATITLQSTSATPVTVEAARDVERAVEAAQGYVDALNAVTETVASLRASDPDAGTAGPLSGDPMARRVVDSLRSSVVASGEHWQVGLSVDRYGAATLDQDALREAFAADFEATAAVFADVGTDSDEIVSTTAATQPGTYDVTVEEAATAAEVIGLGDRERDTVLTIDTSGADSVVVDVAGVTALADVVDQVNAALADAGVTTVSARVEGETIALAESRYGADVTLALHDSGNRFGEGNPNNPFEVTDTGTDVEGTIDGQEAVGSGAHLTAVDGSADGLTVATGAAGTFAVAYEQAVGITAPVSETLARHEGRGGTVEQARQSIDNQIDLYQGRIEAFEDRLASREITLRRQFTAMETAMAQLNDQGAWLSQQLGGLNAQLG